MTGTIGTIIFFVGILSVYYILPVKMRWVLLLAGSMLFYMSADWRMSFLIIGSIAASYYAGVKIENAEEEKKKKIWLRGSVFLLVLVLFLFKYFDFFTECISGVLSIFGMENDALTLRLIIPLGISYYTFKMLSYLADIYSGKIMAEKHIGYYALYILFFPQILCGPIERAEHFLPQLRTGCKFKEALFTEGMKNMLAGLFKKVVIADRLITYVGSVFEAPLEYPALASVFAVFFYAIQIYCDFSGYSDMAIGMAKMFGLRTRENFDYPYFSKDIKEFWKRWHISLSSWLRDYVYIPLGGNRKGKLKTKWNLLVTFLVSGLWHGSSLNFIVWGGIHGIWSALAKPAKEQGAKWKGYLQTLVTFCGVSFAWIFFRAPDLKTAFMMIKHIIFDFTVSSEVIHASILPFSGNVNAISHILIICILTVFLGIFESRKLKEKADSIGWFVIMFAAIITLGKFGSSNFLYGQF